MQNLRRLSHPSYLTLPNETKRRLSCVGSVMLQHGLDLLDLLCLPDSQYSLLSIRKLAQQSNSQVLMLTCVFSTG